MTTSGTRRFRRHLSDAAAGVQGVISQCLVTGAGGSTSLPEGGTLQLAAAAATDLEQPVSGALTYTWGTSDAGQATVDAAGLVTAVGYTGTVTITATNVETGKTGTIVLTLVPDDVPTVVAVSPAAPSVVHIDTQQFTVVVQNQFARTLTGAAAAGVWSSDDPTTATIDQTGLATSISDGTSNINFTTTVGSVSDASPAVLTVTYV